MVVILCALLAPAEPLVTYSNGSISLGRALAEISPQAGTAMTASDALFSRPVFLVLNRVPASEFRARLAEAVLGVWQPDGDTLRLMPERAKIRAQEQADREMRIALARARVEKLRQDAKLGETFDSAAARRLAAQAPSAQYRQVAPGAYTMDRATMLRREAIQAQTPLGRALSEVILMVDPKAWVELPSMGRVVFSSRPTRMQRPLPELGRVMARFAQEQKHWLVASENLSDPIQEWRPQGQSASNEPPDFAMLVASKMGQDSINFNFGIYAKNGASLGSISRSFILDENLEKLMTAGEPAKTAYPKTPIEFSPLAKEMAQALAKTMRGSSGTAPGEQLKKWLLNPEKSDFLGLNGFESTAALARHAGRNVIAFPGDFAMMLGAMPMPGPSGQLEARPVTLADLERMDRAFWSREERGGFWLMRPSGFMRDFGILDRAELGRFLRAAQQRGRLDLRLRGQLALMMDDERAQQVPTTLLQLILPTVSRSEMFFSSDSLRLYASLTPAQVSAARSREGLMLGNLQPEQRQHLVRLIYQRPYVNLQLTPKQNRSSEDYTRFYNGAMRESTYALGDGIPPNGRLTLAVTEETGGQVGSYEREGGIITSGNSTPEELAMMTFSSETTEPMYQYSRPKDVSLLPKLLDNLTLGKRTLISMTILFSPDIQWSDTLSDFDVQRTGVRLADMPKEFRDRYDNYLKMLRDPNNRGRMIAPPGTRTAPPP